MKNLLDKIENINNDIEEINESIESLLLVESVGIVRPFAQWLFRKWLKNKIFDGEDTKEDKKKIKNKFDDWLDSDEKFDDINDVVDDIKDISDEDDEKKVKEFREMLEKIADKQKELLEDIINKKGIDKITVGFNKPIEFELIRGKNKGKELRLEKTKTYEVFMVEGERKKKKIYFNYKTRKENWLRKYSILFSIEIREPNPGKKYDGVTVSIAYVNENLIKDKTIKILTEKVLTHKGMVEIKKLI